LHFDFFILHLTEQSEGICHLLIILRKRKGREPTDIGPAKQQKEERMFWSGEGGRAEKSLQCKLFKNMLANSYRLKKKEFENAFIKGRSFRGDFLFLKFIENKTEGNKIGFIVSKKISNKAVVRNKVKRRLREIIGKRLRGEEVGFKLKKGLDIILTARPGLELKTFLETKNILDDLLSRARILGKEE